METTDKQPRLLEAFTKLAELGTLVFAKEGKSSLQDYPEGWTYDIGAGWWVAMNGQRHPIEVDVRDAPGFGNESHLAEVPAFAAYLMFNGWPAGILYPGSGTIAAGSAANEDTLIEALDAAIRRESLPL